MALGLAVSQAHAGITMTATPITSVVQSDPTIVMSPDLNKWQGYVLTLVADATSAANKGVVTVDFANNPLNLNTGGVPTGIAGQIHQAWNINRLDINGQRISTPSTAADAKNIPTDQNTNHAQSFLITDSTFLNSGYYNVSVATPFSEDNNLANGTNPPFIASPLADDAATSKANGVDFGVGSVMKFAGAGNGSASGGTTLPSLDFAFVIVPAGGTWVQGFKSAGQGAIAWVNGAALDNKSTDLSSAYAIQYSYVTVVPEPASLGVLALGGVALLARRRKA